MFKKRAPPSKKPDSNTNNNNNDDDNSASSPTITVSVPHDVFDQTTVTSTSSTTTTAGRTEERQWNRTTTTTTSSSSRRSSYERSSFLPQNQQQQGSKAWNPQQQQQQQQGAGAGVESGSGLGMTAGAGGSAGTNTSAGTTTSSPSLSTLSSSSSPSSSKPKSSAGMMLNLTGIFTTNSTANGTSTTTATDSTTNTGIAQPHPAVATAVEAQLWNADWVEPASPAFPRYIPAIAGKGAGMGAGGPNPRTGGGGGGGRLNAGWGSGGGTVGVMGRKSGEGAGWKTATATTASSPSFDTRSFDGASQSLKSRVAASTGAGAGYILNSNTNGHSMPLQQQQQYQQQQYQQQPAVSPGLRRNQPLQQRSGGDGTGTGAGGSLEMSWMSGGGGPDYDDNNHHDQDDYDDEDYYKDRKKDRSYYTRREKGHGRGQTSHFPLLFSDPKRVLRARLFCLQQNRRLHPCIRLIVFLFLAGSVCFTTIHLLFLGAGRPDGLGRPAELRKSFDLTEQQLRVRKMLGRSKAPQRAFSSFDVEAQNCSLHQWALDTYDIKNSKAIARVGEDYMLSKAFNGAMHPTRVIPFYFKASFRDEDDDDDLHVDDHHDAQGSNSDPYTESGPGPQEPVPLDRSLVTITTLITPNRYEVFLKLVKQYRGPISVATHIRKGPDQDAMFHELHAFFRDNSILRKYVDLHVIVDGVDFQLNMWRNVARMFARTDYFMMLDVDFHIPSSLKKNLHYDPRIQQLLASGAALVVPAFEYKVDHDPKDSKYFPETKSDLLPLLEKGHIHVFHDSFPPGHGATDTPRWIKMSQGIAGRSASRPLPPKGRAGFEEDYAAAADWERAAAAAEEDEVDERRVREEYLEHEADGERPYKVTKFEPKYEPYVILKKEGTPWCDERFVGYGANKAACLFEIYISGIDFWVMPEDFLIHQYHDYPTTDRKNGRILNRQLFVSFQQEVCFRTLSRMIVTGEWYTSKADNLRHQCSGFEGFLQSADQLAQEFEDRHPEIGQGGAEMAELQEIIERLVNRERRRKKMHQTHTATSEEVVTARWH
ncbi:glycosyltransferase family 49 protein [Linnemannia elongata AG-77]|uniref:Glycosyltransferase family 49 protein n=1 Tax=Linnemannia elongata AG-77 TaxID=1314771 RepID=A0A197JLE5_9FUNG|nr:glycosyltransferase family 49 protein [Linnemannia elongata AG-77]